MDVDAEIETPLVGNDGEGNHIETTGSSLTAYYEGPTTNSEIFGWCLYSWATEPFIVSCIST